MGASHSTRKHGKNSKVTQFHSEQKWKLHFEDSKQSNKLMVIDFSASWCGPCRFMEPIIDEFSAKFTDVEFVKIDVDELADVAKEFGIQSMPTFVFVKNGKEVDKLNSADREELERMIYKYRL
ncbi:OLC1v1028076C1 [Oldenlandia corymbosa var. corymbosa]|uniref:OLC1v1028076C1 n=1 Tax=Oldenlandia corymbosa var. corymbosa TaxID=529605 RepID=A0AAV1CBF4_OLDCO|nr:OLC1v1028076C1 [Oldenlandia corymbosa var. corymbosa]